MPEPTQDTYTNAPEDYDGFGTTTLDARAGYLTVTAVDRGPVRRVRTPHPHVTWQRLRYQSGLYVALTPEQWAEWLTTGDATPVDEDPQPKRSTNA